MKEKNIHKIFFIGLIIKGINATLEIVGGVFFLYSGTLTGILTFLTRKELLEDPNDFFVNYIMNLIPFLSLHTQLFAVFYLFSHGIIKVFLVINLLKNKLWAYPITIIFLLIFIFYQIYVILIGYSTFLILLTLFDIVLIILTWHEYAYIKNKI